MRVENMLLLYNSVSNDINVANVNLQPTLQLFAKHSEEDGEVDWTTGLLDHGLQLLVLHVQLTHGGQHIP